MAAAQISHYSRVIDGVDIPLIIDAAHNEYLNILYHQGIFALLSYIISLVTSLVQWIRVGHKNIASAICGGAVVCYGVQAFFGFSMCQTAALFWLAWAVLNNCSREELSHERIKTINQH
jgi:O-antigen ligase